jgi:hypothetical protein
MAANGSVGWQCRPGLLYNHLGATCLFCMENCYWHIQGGKENRGNGRTAHGHQASILDPDNVYGHAYRKGDVVLCSRPPGAVNRPSRFPQHIGLCMAVVYEGARGAESA